MQASKHVPAGITVSDTVRFLNVYKCSECLAWMQHPQTPFQDRHCRCIGCNNMFADHVAVVRRHIEYDLTPKDAIRAVNPPLVSQRDLGMVLYLGGISNEHEDSKKHDELCKAIQQIKK